VNASIAQAKMSFQFHPERNKKMFIKNELHRELT
jgi:hypothetical protein